MTYTFKNLTMVLVDVGDSFSSAPLLAFFQSGYPISVSEAVPKIQDVEIIENPAEDGFDVVVTHTDGRTETRFFCSMEEVGEFLFGLASEQMAVARSE